MMQLWSRGSWNKKIKHQKHVKKKHKSNKLKRIKTTINSAVYATNPQDFTRKTHQKELLQILKPFMDKKSWTGVDMTMMNII